MAPQAAPSRLRRVLHHPVTARALKSGIAAGLAFLVGGLLPEPINAYNYYAAMGAFSVVLPALADSLQAALRTVLAIMLGIGVAFVLQLLASTSWWVVGLAIGLAVVVAALPVLRNEASWVPLVALFVLAFGGEDPRQFALGYVVQVPLGAIIGISVNYVLVAPLPIHDLEVGLQHYRLALHDRFRQLATAVADGDGSEPLPTCSTTSRAVGSSWPARWPSTTEPGVATRTGTAMRVSTATCTPRPALSSGASC
ncbi:aromatic acid exporter family protein [Ornithinimicrobium sp. F0845]|uniref:FUSC family protein n=1 Tax=Ornithinimicrobium sp. F0845 TaxID=2926412 RepID=UPI001FF23165|nr:aromatic acid exporter family protein [Ornithinimicrobium sp. F0845]